jgi:hypothetical protein
MAEDQAALLKKIAELEAENARVRAFSASRLCRGVSKVSLLRFSASFRGVHFHFCCIPLMISL